MITAARKREILDHIGDPGEVVRSLRRFRRTARILSSGQPRLIDLYNKKWVVVHGGKVAATGRSLSAAMAGADAKNTPRHETIVRYIERDRRTLIL